MFFPSSRNSRLAPAPAIEEDPHWIPWVRQIVLILQAMRSRSALLLYLMWLLGWRIVRLSWPGLRSRTIWFLFESVSAVGAYTDIQFWVCVFNFYFFFWEGSFDRFGVMQWILLGFFCSVLGNFWCFFLLAYNLLYIQNLKQIFTTMAGLIITLSKQIANLSVLKGGKKMQK